MVHSRAVQERVPAAHRAVQVVQVQALRASCSRHWALEQSSSGYDPIISAKTYVDHTTQLLPNQVLYGVPVIHQNTFLGNFTYQQAFPTGGGLQVDMEQ